MVYAYVRPQEDFKPRDAHGNRYANLINAEGAVVLLDSNQIQLRDLQLVRVVDAWQSERHTNLGFCSRYDAIDADLVQGRVESFGLEGVESIVVYDPLVQGDGTHYVLMTRRKREVDESIRMISDWTQCENDRRKIVRPGRVFGCRVKGSQDFRGLLREGMKRSGVLFLPLKNLATEMPGVEDLPEFGIDPTMADYLFERVSFPMQAG